MVRQTKAACSCGLKRLAALSLSVAGWNKVKPYLPRLGAFSQRYNGFSNPAACSGLSHSLNNERLVRFVRETQGVADSVVTCIGILLYHVVLEPSL